MWNEVKILFLDKYYEYKSKNIYPENLKNGIDDILRGSRKIKIAVIDDHDFPFDDTLENEGCVVKCYKKFTKDITQPNQKIKAISIGNPDVIFCDINGVGEELYKDYKGLGVIENLRDKYPFGAIYAYTGTPGFVSTKLKREDAIDGIFAKEWGTDDFLVNFKKVKRKFSCPAERWQFLRVRLKALDASDKKIDELMRAYVKSILMAKSLHQKFGMSSLEIMEIIKNNEQNNIDSIYWAKFGIKSISEIYSIFSPLMAEV